jgi:hypothetical protein
MGLQVSTLVSNVRAFRPSVGMSTTNEDLFEGKRRVLDKTASLVIVSLAYLDQSL